MVRMFFYCRNSYTGGIFLSFIQSVQNLNKFERCLWLGSVCFLSLVFLVTKSCDFLTSLACLVGATALIFVSKGDAIGQLLTILFALLYGLISYQFRRHQFFRLCPDAAAQPLLCAGLCRQRLGFNHIVAFSHAGRCGILIYGTLLYHFFAQ